MPQRIWDYEPSQQEINEFLADKYGFPTIMTMDKPKKKVVIRCLISDYNGHIEIISNDKPYALLQYIKNNMIKEGYKSKHLSILPLDLVLEKQHKNKYKSV